MGLRMGLRMLWEDQERLQGGPGLCAEQRSADLLRAALHAPFDVSAARARVLEARHHAHFGHHVQLSQEGSGRYLVDSVQRGHEGLHRRRCVQLVPSDEAPLDGAPLHCLLL
eukprot:CAMPEP_0198221608 /NCGR_PEP_ID=MMETSP1445-20131203/84396_1 /TAXON_ID=36898 /ORGANISM="Pyramimonas sp., Strain CCMP2087" /LENGTH=111 /DNA_ID=CAMNT_0043899815 /DNA_START=179 /DNA_END=514 /DNA_ORIENTATION=-